MTGDAATSPAPGGHRHEGDLDGDPEALEDPVHRGDATHQHDVHERHAHQPAEQPGADPATVAGTPDDDG